MSTFFQNFLESLVIRQHRIAGQSRPNASGCPCSMADCATCIVEFFSARPVLLGGLRSDSGRTARIGAQSFIVAGLSKIALYVAEESDKQQYNADPCLLGKHTLI